jgi:hypothetical protein
LQDEAEIKKYSEKMPDVGKKFEYLLNTGNLVSRSGLDLSQASGFTIVAEKLNFFRYGGLYKRNLRYTISSWETCLFPSLLYSVCMSL